MWTPATDASQVASSSSSESADECNTAVAHSARALTTNPSQSLAGIVELIVRPMLAAPTVSEEIQRVVCQKEWGQCGVNKWSESLLRSLSAFDLSIIASYGFDGQIPMYDGWGETSYAPYQQNYAATTRYTHDYALRMEFDEFTSSLEETVLLTTDDVNRILGSNWAGRPDIQNLWKMCRELHLERLPGYFVDHLFEHGRQLEQKHGDGWTEEFRIDLYFWFRKRRGATPVSFMVFHDIIRMCRHDSVVQEVVQARDEQQRNKGSAWTQSVQGG